MRIVRSSLAPRLFALALVTASGAVVAAPAAARTVDPVAPVSVSGVGGTAAWLRPVGQADPDGRFRTTQLVVLPQRGEFKSVRQLAPTVVPVTMPAYADRVVVVSEARYSGTIAYVHSPAGWSSARFADVQAQSIRLLAGSSDWSAVGQSGGFSYSVTPDGANASKLARFDPYEGGLGAPYPFVAREFVPSAIGRYFTSSRASGFGPVQTLWREIFNSAGTRYSYSRVSVNRPRKGVRSGLGPVTVTNGVPSPAYTEAGPDLANYVHSSRWIVSKGRASTSITTFDRDGKGRKLRSRRTTLPRRLVRGGVAAIALDGGTVLLSAGDPSRCRTTTPGPECKLRLAKLDRKSARQTGTRR